VKRHNVLREGTVKGVGFNGLEHKSKSDPQAVFAFLGGIEIPIRRNALQASAGR